MTDFSEDKNPNALPERAGQSDAPEGTEQTLVILAQNETGMLDRVVGMLRRRRAQTQSITIGKSELPDVSRITVVMRDTEVEVNQLVEQLRKIVAVRHVVHLPADSSVLRELALIKINSNPGQRAEIIELAHLFGAHLVDLADETVTLEVSGNTEKIEKFVRLVEPFGIREVARTGSVAMTREV
ncbi:MAG TPA: acetolactate synthase small subunit [Ktedonobacteraceae bacterium]|nr:acetolactate synthase small subunit [Ktedonobacteraceae bacterium]